MALALSDAEAVTVTGNTTCSSWTNVRVAPLSNRPMTGIELMQSTWAESWALGFLSGLAVESGSDKLKTRDGNRIFPWIDNACRDEPNSSMGDVLLRWWNANPQ
jgi:hypothetical protein